MIEKCDVASQLMQMIYQIDTGLVLVDEWDRAKILDNINTILKTNDTYYITAEFILGNMVRHETEAEALYYLNYLGEDEFMYWGRVDDETRSKLKSVF